MVTGLSGQGKGICGIKRVDARKRVKPIDNDAREKLHLLAARSYNGYGAGQVKFANWVIVVIDPYIADGVRGGQVK